jgi:C1A family cysteine protease
VDGKCQTTCKNVVGTTVSKHTDVNATEQDLMSAIASQPVSIAIEADQRGFQFYASGVFSGSCGSKLDHGVLAVGYGQMKQNDKNLMYWHVKNSWGSSWGMKGFILLERGKTQSGGQCGILNSASYPTL